MAQYKDVIVNAGAGGFGGPLVLKPDDNWRTSCIKTR